MLGRMAVLAAVGIYPALGSSLSHQHPLQSAAGSRTPRRCRGTEIRAPEFDQRKALPAARARPGLGISQHPDPACQRVQRQHDLTTRIWCLDQTQKPTLSVKLARFSQCFPTRKTRGSQQRPPRLTAPRLLQNSAAC